MIFFSARCSTLNFPLLGNGIFVLIWMYKQGKFYLFAKVFSFNFGRTSVLFVGLLMPLFWNSGNVYPGLQIQGRSPHLYVSLPVHNEILSFTSGVTPTDLLTASMTAKPFSFMYLQISIGGARDLFAKLVFCYRYHRSTILNK